MLRFGRTANSAIPQVSPNVLRHFRLVPVSPNKLEGLGDSCMSGGGSIIVVSDNFKS